MSTSPRSFAKSKSPLAWEQAWQKMLDVLYNEVLMSAKSVELASLLTTKSSAMVKTNHTALCELQHNMLQFAAAKIAQDDFEEKWRAVGSEMRRKYYFEAMRRVCAMPDMERMRRFAPEVSLRKFEARNGQGYLDLLRSLVPEQAHWRLNILCPRIRSFDAANVMIDVQRSLFITLVVWHTLLSFYDMLEEIVNVRSERKYTNKPTPDQVAFLESHGLSPAKLDKEHRQAQRQGQWVCMGCKTPESAFADHKFKSCSKCREAQLNVMYCSRECQVNDWKNGNPPHKTICGKLAHELPTPQSPPSSTSRRTFPEPAPNFRRSMALLQQIALLKKHPSVDYFVIPPSPLPDIGLSFPPSDELGKLFRGMRDRAFETGDKEAVGFMYKFLDVLTKGRRTPGLEGLEKQLGREFGMSTEELREQFRLAHEDLLNLRKSS